MEKRLQELLDKEVLTVEEAQEVDEHEEVTNVENCGNSGRYNGKTWYVVTLEDGTEHNYYC